MNTSFPAQLKRLKEKDRTVISFYIDGQLVEAFEGDTIMTAMLTHGKQLRRNEFSQQPRAGFCMMGACQDCWVVFESGEKVRACSTFVKAGMHVLTDLPKVQ